VGSASTVTRHEDKTGIATQALISRPGRTG
jgi:hypothetical protein